MHMDISTSLCQRIMREKERMGDRRSKDVILLNFNKNSLQAVGGINEKSREETKEL